MNEAGYGGGFALVWAAMKKQEQADQSIFDSLNPDQIKETASAFADQAAKFIKKHPFESVGGALLVGLLAGLLINRKK